MIETDLTCQTCAYWRVSKGSFGQCEGKGKKYDGSRKGSACIGWRQVNQSITSPILVKPPERERYNKVEYKSLRKVYNDLHKPKFKATYATNVDGEFVTYTSDIHCKNGYYKHRYNYTLIDVALTLFLQGKTFKEVVEHMKKNYMKPMSRRTFREWVIKFLGQKAWDASSCNEVFAMCIDDHGIYVKDGKAKNKQVYSCQKCKRQLTDYRRRPKTFKPISLPCIVGSNLCSGITKKHKMEGNIMVLCEFHRSQILLKHEKRK